jgi:HEAT repeat protein
MPKLSAFAREHADLAERFLVVGVHQRGPASLAEAAATAVARGTGSPFGPVDLPPVLTLDGDPPATFDRYDPDSLGDMVLLDARGTVAAVGPQALAHVAERLGALRKTVNEAAARLSVATDPAAVTARIAALCAMDLELADAAAARFAAVAPLPLAPAAFDALASAGRGGLLGDVLSHKEAKRRLALLDVLQRHPTPRLAARLLETAADKRTGPAERCAALRATHAAAPDDERLESLLLETGKSGDAPLRTCSIELLGRLATPAAVERLAWLLAKDVSKPIRLAAIQALAAVGDDASRAALAKAASDDKVESVRAAAQAALASQK